jgi:hypothetical protein
VTIAQFLNDSRHEAEAKRDAILAQTQFFNSTFEFFKPALRALDTRSWSNLTEAAWICLAKMGVKIESDPQVAAHIQGIIDYQLAIRAQVDADATLVPRNPMSYMNPLNKSPETSWLVFVLGTLWWSLVINAIMLLFIFVPCSPFCVRLNRWTRGVHRTTPEPRNSDNPGMAQQPPQQQQQQQQRRAVASSAGQSGYASVPTAIDDDDSNDFDDDDDDEGGMAASARSLENFRVCIHCRVLPCVCR